MSGATGDWGPDVNYSDPSGSGDFSSIANSGDPNASPSPLTLDYYKNQIQAFQDMLNSLDSVYYDMQTIGAAIGDDPDLYQEWLDHVNDFESKRATIQTVATTLNTGIQGLNAVGININPVQIPGGLAGLGVAPLIILAGVIGTVVVLVNWGKDFFAWLNDFTQRQQMVDAVNNLPEAQRNDALQALNNAYQKSKAALENKSSSYTAALKYVVIGLGMFFAYKVWKESR